MLIRARLVLPVGTAPIENGFVRVERGRITGLGKWEARTSARQKLEDLGEVILMPGLINAHCHLDYTCLAGHLPPPRSFSTWIQALVALKASLTPEELADSWRAGAEMLARTGTTTVADTEAYPELLPTAWESTRLRIISFREIIALRDDAAARAAVEQQIRSWRQLTSKCRRETGLSPHAPYTTTAAVLSWAKNAARARGWRLVTHVAESAEEWEMFQNRQGRMFDWLKSQRKMSDCGERSPVQHLEHCGYLGEDVLAIHANYLGPGDVATLAQRRTHVVHCPRSHEYFGHSAFAYGELTKAGLNVCLGTDSLASVRKGTNQKVELNLFSEMQAFAAKHPEVDPGTVLKMATVNGARALGLGDRLGAIRAGMLADLIALPFAGPVRTGVVAAVNPVGPPARVMVGGKWIQPPGR
jgi:cytosine/adenosine deaminase-related metal-dependent hydrolase